MTGAELRGAAPPLGWVERLVPAETGEPNATVVVTKTDAPLALLGDLVALVEIGSRSDWWLSRLSVSEVAPLQASATAVFTGGRRVRSSMGTSAAAARRRATGARSGRTPTIDPEVLARMVAERSAGRGYRAIAAELEAAEVPTANGGRHWYPSTVRAALRRAAASD